MPSPEEFIPPSDVHRLIETIGHLTGARSLGFGYESDPTTGEAPAPGEPVTWYAELITMDGEVIFTKVSGLGVEAMFAPLIAVAQRVGVEVSVYERDVPLDEPPI